MDLRNFSRKFFLSTIAIGLTSVSLSVAASQFCDLGKDCSFLSNDLGGNHFKVTPFWGTKYICDVSSNGGSLKFFVTGGHHFTVKHGWGYYNANPYTTVEVIGEFKNPNDTGEQGEIRITRLPFTADGSVRCYPKF